MELFRKIFSIDKEDEVKILLLFFLGFFLGIFNVTFLVESSSAFLSLFDEKEDLSMAIIFSGVFGVIAAYAFSVLQQQINFFRLSVYIFSLILFTVVGLRFLHAINENKKTLTFISYILIGPFHAMTMLVFWGIVGRLFTIKQTRKIIGNIDTGQLLGTIIASFSIPIILKFMVDSINLLILGSVSIFFALVFCVLLNIKYKVGDYKVELTSGIRKQNKINNLFKNKYLVVMGAFIVVSMVASIFVDYSFLHVTAQNYPDAKDLAIFLAKFEGTILVFSFLVQTFVTDRLIAIYGIKTTLLVTPTILFLLTVVAMVIGISIQYGDILNIYALFFLIVSVSKLVNTALRDSIDGPTFKLYFLPFDFSVRLDVQTKIEGVVKLFAGLVAGLILIGIEATKIFSVIHISFFLLLIIGIWFYITTLLHRKYKDTLQTTLSTTQRKETYKNEYIMGEYLKKELENENPHKVVYTLNIIENLYPLQWEEALKIISRKEIPQLQQSIKDTIQSIRVESYNLTPLVPATQLIRESVLIKESAYGEVNKKLSQIEIKRLVKSQESQSRVLAARLLRKSITSENVFLLNELLKDTNRDVVFAAIYTAKIFKHPETYSFLIELLSITDFSNPVINALVHVGDEVIASLEIAFHKAGQKEDVMYRIVYIYGKIGSATAIEKLWLKLNYPDLKVYNLVLRTFSFWKIRVSAVQLNLVNALIENEIRKAAWNISAQAEIFYDEANHYLFEALDEEINNNYDNIFILLSLIYDDKSVQLVRDNIESGTSEGKVFALELLDIFLAKELKAILFPLLEDLPINEKIRNLQIYFPREFFDSVEVLKQIINRDYNNITKWTKACALWAYGHTDEAEISDDLVANFFNPNHLIRETAAWAVVKKDKNVFKDILTRILNQKKTKNEFLVELSRLSQLDNKRILRFEKIRFLKKHSYFSSVPGAVLSDMCDSISEIELNENAEIVIDNLEKMPLFFIYRGSIAVFKDNIFNKEFEEGGALAEMFSNHDGANEYKIIAHTNTILFKIPKTRLLDFMNKHFQVTQSLLNNITLSGLKDLQRQ